MSLLSPNTKLKIRGAIKQVTDTFMVTPVIYHLSGDSLDRFAEDRNDEVFYSVLLKTLVEEDIETNKIKESLQGAKNEHMIKLSFNLEDLEAESLITSDYKFISNPTTDYFGLRGELYKVVDIHYDGPLDQKNVLVVILGEKSKNTRVSMNTITTGNQIPVDEIISNDITNKLLEIETRITTNETNIEKSDNWGLNRNGDTEW